MENQNSPGIEKHNTHLLRGGELIQEGEINAHLALALRLENVGVLLGAGASCDAGGKLMKEVWDELIPESTKTWLISNKFALQSLDIQTPNIEEILSLLAIAEHDYARRSFNDADLRTHFDIVRRSVINAAMLSKDLWIDRGSVASQGHLEPYHRLLARLQGSRQPGQAAPWLFTLNYDLSVEWAAEGLGIHVVNGFAGLHDRCFQPNAFDLSLQNTRAIGEARFGSYNVNLVKMHGSLSWRLRQDDRQAIEVSCESIRSELENYLEGKNKSEMPSLLIQPTTAKYVDTVGFIYGEMIRRFTEFLARPNTALIICGYSFNDEHINRLLASGLLNPTLQLIIYYPPWSEGEDIANDFLRKIRSLGLPRVIIRGGGEKAFFKRMVNDLPDPAMVEELSPQVKRLLSQIAKGLPSLGDESDPV